MSRSGFKITRVSETENYTVDKETNLTPWLEAFAQKLKNKTPANAVEAARQRDAQSLYDQISSIVSNKPVHSSVEDKVKDYHSKIGLQEYLKRVSDNKSNMKLAGFELDWPESFGKFSNKDKEDIINFIRNKCETHHGNIQVPALAEDVKQTFKQRGLNPQDINDPKFEKIISDEILKCKKMNPSTTNTSSNIGKGVGVDSDLANDGEDFFEHLLPHKK